MKPVETLALFAFVMIGVALVAAGTLAWSWVFG